LPISDLQTADSVHERLNSVESDRRAPLIGQDLQIFVTPLRPSDVVVVLDRLLPPLLEMVPAILEPLGHPAQQLLAVEGLLPVALAVRSRPVLAGRRLAVQRR